MNKDFENINKGFTLVEIVASLAIFSIILLAVISFLFSMSVSNSQVKASREALENAKRALEEITYEIRSAKSIYTPTTTSSQLSLETSRYIPAGEDDSYVDFYLCSSAICFKKDSQDAVVLTSNSVQITSLSFLQILTGTSPSVQVSLTVNYSNPGNKGNSSVSLTSTASLRGY